MDNQTVKFREMYNLAIQWVVIHQKNIDLSDELVSRGHKKIVIYGMSDIGNRLWFELNKSDKVEVIYTIDQGEPKQYYEFKCFKLDETKNCEAPDVIIVTVPYMYDTIKDNLLRYFNCDIISMTDLLYEADR